MKESHKKYFDKFKYTVITVNEGSYELQMAIEFPYGKFRYRNFWMSKSGLDELLDNWDKIEAQHKEDEYQRWFGRFSTKN